MILMARSYEDSQPSGVPGPEMAHRPRLAVRGGRAGDTLRILLLGWSHKVPALLDEFASYPNERFVIDSVSAVPVSERETAVARYGVDFTRLQLDQQEADYTVKRDLDRLDPGSYDNVVMIGSDWLSSGEESDARTIMGVLLLQEILAAREGSPRLLVELMDPENVGLLGMRTCDVLVSPMILSHMLALVAMRRELSCVFDELFTTQGPEIVFLPVSGTAWQGKDMTFSEIRKEVCSLGGTALGVHVRGEDAGEGDLCLNPDRTEVFRLHDADEIVLLTTYE